jgi:hypothetical protein|tara:strand:- start:3106 stop:3402 length:297 start_codon:yes stop_codon:yes gene_type:complete
MTDVDTVEVTKQKPAAKRSATKPSRVNVIFHNQEGDLGKTDIFVSVNGYAYQIKRNEPVSLPSEVIEVIDNAVVTHIERVNGVDESRDLQRFTYSLAG